MAASAFVADRGINAGRRLKWYGRTMEGRRQRHKGAKATGRQRFRTNKVDVWKTLSTLIFLSLVRASVVGSHQHPPATNNNLKDRIPQPDAA